MKILVLSDSHQSISFMRYCIDRICPDHIIHLGDHYDDAKQMEADYPHIRFHIVPGNCDRYSMFSGQPAVMYYDVAGVRIFMTHGHLHGVKSDIFRLLADAWEKEANAVVFGHTHEAVCFQTEDGMYVLNPGSCRSFSGSVGLIETDAVNITACRILRQADVENIKA